MIVMQLNKNEHFDDEYIMNICSCILQIQIYKTKVQKNFLEAFKENFAAY